MIQITPGELEELLHGFRRSAFRLEAQPAYQVGAEADALRAFTEGHPHPPREYGWWQEWLDLIASHTAKGHAVERVRVVDEPPTSYQQWLLWSDRWHLGVGEHIACLPRSRAKAIGLPLASDWWLFDNTKAAVMWFLPGGTLDGIYLATAEDDVRPYRLRRDLALAHATAAGIAA